MGNRLLIIILLIGTFAVSGTWTLVLNLADDMLEEQARSESLAWAQFVRRDLRDLDHILRGAPPTITDIQTLSTAKNVGNVIWFKIYDHDRTVVWAKDFMEIGDENTAPYFINIVSKGTEHVELDRPQDEDTVIAHAFLPIMDDDKFLGAIEVSLDLTHIAKNSQKLAFNISSGLAILFVLLLIITAYFARREIKRERSLKEDAQQAARARNDFIAMVSHELRTPLNGVLGALGLMRETRNQREIQNLSTTAIHSTEHLLEIINEIIDFTQVSAHRAKIEPSPVNPHELAREIETIFKIDAQEKGLKLILENKLPTEAMGETDLKRLRQILFNLVSNAIKFTEQGKVVITFDIDEKVKRTLCCQVSDTGIGLSPKDQQEIFTKFHQVDNSLSRKQGGIGLGLSICRELAQLMGGSLNLTSKLNQGSHFSLRLPFEKVSVPYTEKDMADDTTENLSLNLLLVEDNAVNQKVLKTILEKPGHQVTLAENGREAVEMAADQTFDLILMDIQMPLMNGEEATKEIRTKEGPNQHTPIIALSANILANQKEAYFEAGMNDCLAKPIKPLELRQAVVDLYQKHSSQD
ncbi:ATP-binding protein [Terasakiella sp. A23]|uniref:ATP-binding protein n=1 Tax=Terasakiella sp. FCG-A23 TaxID=3080561 RepID=UPI0029540A1A|nr:ATP-binding protein [Terasakiella sp. A23]MDV7339211.1 ATP-binding protein [Terasakiella sp. A23]